MVEFRTAQHSVTDTEVVEVYVNGVFKAVIYPDHHNGAIRVVSSHLEHDEPLWSRFGQVATCWFRFSKERPA